jgi:thioredoxin reductase (NADPH)
MTTTEVENFPGFAHGVTGPMLMQQLRDQAKRFGTIMHPEDVNEVDFGSYPFVVKGKKHHYEASCVIIATGATAKRLDILGTREGEFWQKGVSACAICDGAMPIFREKDLYVIGGGDSAVEEALFLTKYASKIYVVHRRDSLRASKIMAERLLKHPKVEVLWNSVLTQVSGGATVEKVTVQNVVTGEIEEKPAGGVFFAIGHKPNTDFLNGQLKLDESGYIILSKGTATSIDGVFAAGDVADHVYRQAVTAAGTGCMAAIDAERWLSSREG